MKSIFVNPSKVHPSWAAFISDVNVQRELMLIEKAIESSNDQYTPVTDKVLRFLETDLGKVRACILGQDPYPQNGVATGRSFEVGTVTSWLDGDLNPSMKNILKALHKAYHSKHKAESIATVREEIAAGKLPIPPAPIAFGVWESNGALFLNRAFTCKIGGRDESNQHAAIWKNFFLYLLKYMTRTNPNIKYFLWGKARWAEKHLLGNGVFPMNIYSSKHPVTNGDGGGYKKDSAFLENPCFVGTESVWFHVNIND